MRRLFQPMRSPLGPYVLTAAIALAQFAPAEGANLPAPDPETGQHWHGRPTLQPSTLSNMDGALPEGAPMQVAAT